VFAFGAAGASDLDPTARDGGRQARAGTGLAFDFTSGKCFAESAGARGRLAQSWSPGVRIAESGCPGRRADRT
jgi:hypothetical protein